MKAEIRWNPTKNKYTLVHQGKVIVSSKTDGYISYLVKQQKHTAIVQNKITDVTVTSRRPDIPMTLQDTTGTDLVRVEYTITKRFDFMKQMIMMVIHKNAKSIIISGEGGIGKTFSVLECLRAGKMIDVNECLPTIAALDLIKTPDSDEVMATKALAQINRPKGDYVLIKGYSSAAALYRILYENRFRIIIFDDCDSVLRDQVACALLKSALDSYDERWVSWRVERQGDSDLPPAFKFEGSIIFISNRPLSSIDEAVKTRAYKVDLSMTKAQRIEWMRERLEGVLPQYDDLRAKHEALDLLEANMHLTNDINFRTLMSLITIRLSPDVKDWQELAKFTLTEQ